MSLQIIPIHTNLKKRTLGCRSRQPCLFREAGVQDLNAQNRAYYQRRANQELKAAKKATNRSAVEAHNELAERYLKLLDAWNGSTFGTGR